MTKVKKHGLYVVIEGTEGVGKTLQVNLLADRLQSEGYLVRKFREPDSHSDVTARAIRTITQDPFYPMNTRTEVLLYNAARSQSLENIRNSRAQGIVCLCDRNYLTTLAIQYYGRGDVPDYDTINNIISFAVGDMEPDITIVLDAPVIELKKRAHKRERGERFDNLDLAFLERVRTGYLLEAKQRNYPVVTAIDEPQKVNDDIWNILHGAQSHDYTVTANITPPTPPITADLSDAGRQTATSNPVGADETGQSYLENIITNTSGNVYAFTNSLSPEGVASVLTHQGRDIRTTLLNNRDISEHPLVYGDNSARQLIAHHFVIENASNLLLKKLEWGRLATYIEHPNNKLHYDKKDKYGKYRYFVPDVLPNKTKLEYIEALDIIFDKYSEMLNKLTDYLQKNSAVPKNEQNNEWQIGIHTKASNVLRGALPVATKTSLGIYASNQAIENLICHLLWDNLPEARVSGKSLLDEAKKIIPNILENTKNPYHINEIVKYNLSRNNSVRQIADNMQTGYTSDTVPVKLVGISLRNELDIIPDILYEYSNLSLAELRNIVDKWSYKEKLEVFYAYVGNRQNRHHKPGRALEKIEYSWDIICDYNSFCDLQRHRIVNDLTWQQLSPRFGYDIPPLIEQAGIAEQYLDCFDISVELYNNLQQQGFELEAQYATLLGHKMRWKVTYNAREAFHIHELRTSQLGEYGYRKLVQAMHEELVKVHPLIAEAMKFVNPR